MTDAAKDRLVVIEEEMVSLLQSTVNRLVPLPTVNMRSRFYRDLITCRSVIVEQRLFYSQKPKTHVDNILCRTNKGQIFVNVHANRERSGLQSCPWSIHTSVKNFDRSIAPYMSNMDIFNKIIISVRAIFAKKRW